MNSRHVVTTTRWIVAFGALAGIVLAYHRWLHVNSTTVALTLVLYVLIVGAQFSLRYAVAVSIVATACYNFYFLPPIGNFTITDPQNWLALFAFLVTSVIGSRLAEAARDEAAEVRMRQRELEILFVLSRNLLQTENIADLVHTIPESVNSAAQAESVLLYLLEGDRLYQAGLHTISGVEMPHFRQLALTLSSPEMAPGTEARVPLRAGVRPRGLLVLRGVRLSMQSFHAIGGLVSIAIDRSQALEEVARSEAGKESERLRTLILDSITHELRTPLTAIKGAASTLLTAETLAADAQHELLSIIDEEADRLNRLVSEAVEMAQLEAQEVQMHIVAADVHTMVEAARESCMRTTANHPITVNVPPLPKVAADGEMIGKVLCNLLENAMKYSKPDTPIFISAEQKDGWVYTSVADRGMGIDATEQSLIFDRLYRSPRHSDTISGTGMGLAISRAIVESHRGKLTVTSQPQHGSVFTFSLPVVS